MAFVKSDFVCAGAVATMRQNQIKQVGVSILLRRREAFETISFNIFD